MILSNVEIVKEIKAGSFTISDIAGMDPSHDPFNTSAVDLRLREEIIVPNADQPFQFNLRKPGIAKFLQTNSRKFTTTEEQPYILRPNTFVLANTVEEVNFQSLRIANASVPASKERVPWHAVEF